MEIFGLVKRVKSAPHQNAYAGYAVELPSLIRNNGLAQTLAFLEHKAQSDDTARATGARDLREDVCEVLRGAANPADLGAFDYLIATRRALEASEYFKRYAESVLGADRSQRSVQS